MIFVEKKVGESNTGQVKSYPNLMADGFTLKALSAIHDRLAR